MSADSTTEFDLISQAGRGSPEAFATLVRNHHAAVRSFLAQRTGDPEAADDLAQEVFLAAHAAFKRFREESAFRTWLFGIAKNQAAAWARRETRRRRAEGAHLEASLLEWRQAARSQERDLQLETDRLSALRGCIEKLSSSARKLVVAHYFDRQPAHAIAESMGRRPGSIRMVLLRVRKTLSSCVERELGRLAP